MRSAASYLVTECVARSGSLRTHATTALRRCARPACRRSISICEVVTARILGPASARVLASALTGQSWHAFHCTVGDAPDEAPTELNASGLTARAAAVRKDIEATFGSQELGGFAPGGVRDGHREGSAHYDGRAIDVFFRPVSEENKERGWALAHYLVAHASRLDIRTVIFDGQIWSAGLRSGSGWRRYAPDTSGRDAETAAILEHRDHVHVNVHA